MSQDFMAERIVEAYQAIKHSNPKIRIVITALQGVVNHDFRASSWAHDDKYYQGEVGSILKLLSYKDGTPEFNQGVRMLNNLYALYKQSKRIN